MASHEPGLQLHVLTIQAYQEVLKKYVKPSDILADLATKLKKDMFEIHAKEVNEGPEKGMELMLQKLIQYNDPELLHLFGLALKEHDYEFVLNILRGYSDIKHQEVYENILNLMFVELKRNIQPMDLMAHLKSNRVLSESDSQEISAAVNQRGNEVAAFMLLMNIGRKKEDWFPVLMHALLNNKYGYLVKAIDPKLAEAESLEDMKALCEKWKAQTAFNSSWDDDKSEVKSEQLCFSEDGLGKGNLADQSRDFGEEVSETLGFSEDGSGKGNFAENRSEPDGIEHSLEENMDRLSLGSTSINESQEVPPRNTRRRDLRYVEADDTSNTERRDPQPLQLRPYQEELARDAMKGENRVIVAPTGSGKTHVAMAIIKNHFETQNDEGNNKAVFIVPTTALVEQQKKQLVTYLSQRVVGLVGLSGETHSGGNLAIELLLNKFDVFVLTPQILVDALGRGDDAIDSLAVFSLLVFDECHHCMKDHAYNIIMKHYHEEKAGTDNLLPQIVGLTASVGVGKARTQKQAQEHVLKLLANLDAKITTVRENVVELGKHSNTPEEQDIPVRGRKSGEDPFFDKVNNLMRNIEAMITEEIGRHSGPSMEELRAKHRPPKGRDEQLYKQWIAAMDKEVARVRDQFSMRPFYICIKYLNIYHNGLLINSDCRTKDAVEYVDTELKKERDKRPDNVLDGTDEMLLRMYEDIEQHLRRAKNDQLVSNPKLDALKNVILQKYNEVPDSRGILFCKTRELTFALENWMNEDPDLRVLKAKHLVGTNAPSRRKGMTQSETDNVLQFFRDGEHRLIIATTVAEEGLDISKCNFVVKYEHVTNETARIQSKGRARAERANYVLVAERGKGALEKESLNRIREDMMHNALRVIQSLDPEEFRKRIHELQYDARVSRQMKDAAKERQLGFRAATGNEYQLRCRKCDSLVCRSSEIRRIQNSHYVNIDEEFYRQATITYQSSFTDFGGSFIRAGILQCKNCREDWGMLAIYESTPIPVISMKDNFVVVEVSTGKSDIYKKWNKVPFSGDVQNLTTQDLLNAKESAQKLLDPVEYARMVQTET